LISLAISGCFHLSSPYEKNKPLWASGKTPANFRASCPSGGADHDRHERGTGCGGRWSPGKACEERADGQAVWSCPPDAGDKFRETSFAGRRGLTRALIYLTQ